jgi:hypothetical protein
MSDCVIFHSEFASQDNHLLSPSLRQKTDLSSQNFPVADLCIHSFINSSRRIPCGLLKELFLELRLLGRPVIASRYADYHFLCKVQQSLQQGCEVCEMLRIQIV